MAVRAYNKWFESVGTGSADAVVVIFGLIPSAEGKPFAHIAVHYHGFSASLGQDRIVSALGCGVIGQNLSA